MSIRNSRFFAGLLLILGLWLQTLPPAMAQDSLSRRAVPSRTYNKFTPSALRVGVDMISLGTNFLDRNQKKFEFNADIDVHKYFLNFDYGYNNLFEQGTNGSVYQSTGNFFRLGPDVNLLGSDPFRNVFFFGARYGRSFFSDALTFSTTDPTYGAPGQPFSSRNTGAQLQWAELVAGVKIQVVKQLFIGFTGRYKIRLGASGLDNLIPYEVPGYGPYANQNVFGFNYYVFYRFAFWNKPIPPKSTRKKRIEEEEEEDEELPPPPGNGP